MPATLSIMHLHLRYRLWIAEMNADINVLRIFNDYLLELEAKKKVLEVMKGIDHFKKQFISLRKELDELSHEMHLIKMKLAAAARENKPLTKKNSSGNNHKVLKKSYNAFRKTFTKVKKEFGLFEGKWLG
jgi:uncharacterized coiled-coil DUF342 family protein